jgi:hypothetical protein
MRSMNDHNKRAAASLIVFVVVWALCYPYMPIPLAALVALLAGSLTWLLTRPRGPRSKQDRAKG